MMSIGRGMKKLNRGSPVPLYYQLKEILRAKIAAGEFDGDGQFPSEREIVERYEISRMTARQALSELVNEGLLIREQGRGTFVVQPRIQDQLRHLTSFTEDMQLRGLITKSKIIEFQVVTDQTVTKKMEIPADEEFVQLQRLRYVGDEPVALQTAFVRYCFCPGMVDQGLVDGSLYKTLEEHYGLRLGRAVQTIEAKPADEYEEKTLGVELDQPVLSLERLTYLQNGQPIEYVRSTYRGDRYRFTVELSR